MKAIYRNFCVGLLVLCLTASRVPAQDAEGPVVHVRFRTLGTLDGNGGEVFYGSDKKDVPIKADENVRSIFYEYKGPTTLEFYHLKTNPDKTVVHVPVANVDLTGKGAWPLLLLNRGPKPDSVQILAVSDDFAAFPPNSYRFVNRSKNPCAGVLGKESFVLAPNELKLLLPLLSPNPAHRTLLAQVVGGADRRLIYTSNWVFRPGARTMVFINEGGGDFGVARRIVESAEILITEMKKDASH